MRHILREIFCRGVAFECLDEAKEKINIPGLVPVYDEDSLERKLIYMNSGRRFLGHVRKFAGMAGVRLEKIAWNLFLLRDVRGNNILVGHMTDARMVVVAFQGPAEEGFVGMMQTRQPEFVNIDAVEIEEAYKGDPYAAAQRRGLETIRQLLQA